MKWASIVDHPQILQFAIAILFYGAVMAWSAITMHQAMRDQRERQKKWLAGFQDDWK